jgi:hypothetical protein
VPVENSPAHTTGEDGPCVYTCVRFVGDDGSATVPIAADYPFMDVLWSMIIFFSWVIWIWVVITVLMDVFRRHDIGGFAKVLWVIFVVVLPWLGVLIYLIVEHDGMRERSVKQAQAQRHQFDQ